jgi:hypothetical protein
METKNILIGSGILLGGFIIGSIYGGVKVAKAVCADPTKCINLLPK